MTKRLTAEQISANVLLFIELKALRSRLAAEANVPAYIVFSDAALRDMCRLRPVNRDEFLNVSGVGKRKAKRQSEPRARLTRKKATLHTM